MLKASHWSRYVEGTLVNMKNVVGNFVTRTGTIRGGLKHVSYSISMETGLHLKSSLFPLITGLPVRPVIKWAFGRLRRKTASRGREDRTVWYRETMFSQMVSYDFLLHGLLHEYFLYLVCAPLENPEGVANLKKAICVVRGDSIIGVTL